MSNRGWTGSSSRAVLAIALLAVALGVSACGGDDDETTAAETTAPAPSLDEISANLDTAGWKVTEQTDPSFVGATAEISILRDNCLGYVAEFPDEAAAEKSVSQDPKSRIAEGTIVYDSFCVDPQEIATDAAG